MNYALQNVDISMYIIKIMYVKYKFLKKSDPCNIKISKVFCKNKPVLFKIS